MKYVFILNSFGNKDIKKTYNRIDEISKYLGIDYIIEVNSKFESTEEILNRYKYSNDIIVAVGGDGMINRVLNGIVDTDNLLSYIPNGTGNDFNRTVKETLNSGSNKIDVVRINNKHFINVACFGVDAEIANDDRFVHCNFLPKFLRYDAGVIYHFFSFKPKSFEVSINDEVIKGDFTTIALTNARYYGNGYNIGPSSEVNDGKIEVYLVEELKKLEMAKTILSMKEGKHEDSPYIIKKTTDKLSIKSDNLISSNIDGEPLNDYNFDIEVLPKKIEVYNNEDLIDLYSNYKHKNKTLSLFKSHKRKQINEKKKTNN